MDNNKLSRFNPDKLPAYFKDLTEKQQEAYLQKLAENDAEIKKMAEEKVVKSKVAEHDMGVDLEYLKQIETENKVVNIKRTYETGSGKMDVNIKGGDKKFLIPIMVVLAIVLIAILVILGG